MRRRKCSSSPLATWADARGWDLRDFTLQLLFTGTFLVMLVLQPLYGALVARWPRRVFLPVVYFAFIACLALFYVAFVRQWSGRGVVFFIWISVFNLFAVSVFWSFMGASAAAILGVLVSDWLINREEKRESERRPLVSWLLGVAALVPAWLVALILAALIER